MYLNNLFLKYSFLFENRYTSRKKKREREDINEQNYKFFFFP
jgi:hypothetical protein